MSGRKKTPNQLPIYESPCRIRGPRTKDGIIDILIDVVQKHLGKENRT